MAQVLAQASGQDGDTVKLLSSRAKFERARLHRDDLLQSGLTWLQKRMAGHSLAIEKRTQPWRDGGEVVSYSVGEPTFPVPIEIALILGDALFDYRASLDHLAWQLVTETGSPKRPQDVYFPVVSVKARFDDELRRKLPGVSPVVASIVRRHQPYQNGQLWAKHPLAILNAWNAIDKHRAVPIVATNALSINVELPGKYPNFDVWKQEGTNNPGLLTPGTELIRIYGKRIDPKKEHGVLVKFGGQAGIAYEGNSLEATLGIIDSGVDNVLSEFERL